MIYNCGKFGIETDSEQITSVCVFLLWLLVAGATCRDLITGGKKLFNALPDPKHRVNEGPVETVGDVPGKNA